MAAFELATVPRDLNAGVQTFDVRTVLPTQSVTSARAGTFQTTIFEWKDTAAWWCPSQSYFNIRGHFTDTSGNALARTSGIAYCDNWVSTLFSRIDLDCNGKTIESVQNVAQADTMNLYSTADKTYLESFGSACGAGEAYTTRKLNSAQFGTASVSSSNYNEVVATWRPPCGVFNIPTGIPPGATWRVTFTWNRSCEQNVIQSDSSKIAGTDYYFYVDEFYMSYETIQPSPNVPMPEEAVIDINSIQCNLYSATTANSTFNCTIPSRTTRVLVGFQDNNVANNLAAGQNGLKPFTAFTLAGSVSSTDYSGYLTNIYGSFIELGYTFPQTQYNFTAGSSAGAKTDLQRAYADWINVTRGCSGGYEGSVPFGCYDAGIGAAILQPLSSTPGPNMLIGDPNNPDQSWIVSNTSGAGSASTLANQTARTGWLGKVPIFAMPVVVPEGRQVTKFNLYCSFSSSITAVNAYVVAMYGNTLLCRHAGNGVYLYDTSATNL